MRNRILWLAAALLALTPLALAPVALSPLWLSGTLQAADGLAPVPRLGARITDTTGTLTGDQILQLERELAAFEQSKGSQLGVLIVPSTQPEAIEQYSIRVVEQWKLGRKRVDDGALLLIAKDDRTMRIEVGYGLEGALNDATCKRIISEIITPAFRQGDFYGGIQAGLERMMAVVQGEPLPPPQAAAPLGLPSNVALGLLVLALGAGLLARTWVGRLQGAVMTGGVVGWLAYALLGALAFGVLAGVAAFALVLLSGLGRGGTYRSGGMGGGAGLGGMGGMRWGTGGGGFGGFGGSGGFGGFSGGGGGFGGGGASGKW